MTTAGGHDGKELTYTSALRAFNSHHVHMKKNKRKIKIKKRSIKLIQKELWELCKKIIKKKYGNTCYTCGQENLVGVNWHTGHCFPKKSVDAFLKYDLRNLRPQCFYCNMRLGGNGARFIKNMERIEGDEYVRQILADLIFMKVKKPYDFYVSQIDNYRNIWSFL